MANFAVDIISSNISRCINLTFHGQKYRSKITRLITNVIPNLISKFNT